MHVTSHRDDGLVSIVIETRVCVCYNLQPPTYRHRECKEEASVRLEVAWPKRGCDLPSSFILPVGRNRMTGRGRQIRLSYSASGTTDESALRSCARNEWRGTSCALGCPLRPLRARARTGSRSSASQCNDRRRVVFSSPCFKENETILRRRTALSLFFWPFTDRSGHARSLTPSPTDSQFRCQRDYVRKRCIGRLRTREYHFRGGQVLQSICSISVDFHRECKLMFRHNRAL